MNVKVHLVPKLEHPLKHNTNVTFHSGAAEAEARVRLLERDQLAPGATQLGTIKAGTSRGRS